jgi:1-deoxy-D-xylulose-5-phosphate synthase
MNESELRNLMYTAQLPDKGPFSIRYPRGEGVQTDWKQPFKEIKIGTGRRVRNGSDLAILTIGHPGNFALDAAEQLRKQGADIAVYDMRFVKPIDEILLHEVFAKFDKVITVEDGCLMGGLGSAVLEFMADNNYQAQVVRLGMEDRYYEHGSQDELYAEAGFGTADIAAKAYAMLKSVLNQPRKQTIG